MRFRFGLPFIFTLAIYAPDGNSASAHSLRGITEPISASTISSTVAGRVAAIRKKEGESVRKGEVILELEKEAEELEAALRKLIADNKVEAASAAYRDSVLKIEFESTRLLHESTKSVSREEVLKKELEYKLAKAESDRLDMQEKREDLEYRIALAHVRKRVITAPFDAQVVKIHPKLAESCNPQEPLVRLADVTRCRFVAHADGAAAAALSTGMKVRLAFPGIPSPVVKEGTVEFVSPVMDPSSGLREVKILFDNADRKIKPGVTGTLDLSGTP